MDLTVFQFFFFRWVNFNYCNFKLTPAVRNTCSLFWTGVPKLVLHFNGVHKFLHQDATCAFFCFSGCVGNNDWATANQTLFTQHKHNKPFVAPPVKIYSTQHFIPQFPCGIHYFGFLCSVRVVGIELKGLLCPGKQEKYRNHGFPLLSAGVRIWQLVYEIVEKYPYFAGKNIFVRRCAATDHCCLEMK